MSTEDATLFKSVTALIKNGEIQNAIDVLFALVKKEPTPRAWSRLVAILLEAGEDSEAHEQALASVARAPGSWIALESLARSLVAARQFDGAADNFLACAQIRRSQPLGQDRTTVPVHHLLHTIEQFEYLSTGAHDWLTSQASFDVAPLHDLRAKLRAMAAESGSSPAYVAISGSDADHLLRPPFVAPAHAPDPAPLRNNLAWESIDSRIAADPNGYLVVDNLLTAPALHALREYCLGATVWQRPYKFGYVGAFPEDGFAGRILFDIADALFRLLPQTLAGMHLMQWWAFAYDSGLPGTDIHGDDSDISVNLWITPDAANLDRERGGLVIWNAMPPQDWSFNDYNSSGSKTFSYLTEIGATCETIPHAENRALIFRGKLMHRSDSAQFLQGYENRRRNVTLLFRRPRFAPKDNARPEATPDSQSHR